MMIYLLGALGAGTFWLGAFLLDKTTPKTDIQSWVVLGIATLIWPISVPLACLEMLNKAKHARVKESPVNAECNTL